MEMIQPTSGFIVNGAKPVKLKRIPVLILDAPGVNRKVYPKDVVRDAIENWKKLVQKDPTRRYIFAKHPKDEDEEWLGIIAGVIDDLYIDDGKNVLFSDATILPTVWGHAIAWLLEHGYTIGVSIRGDARLEDTYYKSPDGKMIPVRKVTFLSLDGYDFVVFPSYVVTQVTKENVREQRQKYPYEVGDDVDIICSLTGVCNCNNQLEKVKEQADSIITLNDIKKEMLQEPVNTNEINVENITVNDNTTFEQPIQGRLETMTDKEILQAEIERLKYEKARHELELEKIREQIKRAQTELESLQKELNETLEKVKEQRVKAQAEEEYVMMLANKKAELEKVKEQIENFTKQKEALEAELEKVKEQIENFAKQKEALEAELKEKEAELEKVKEQLEQVQEKGTNLMVRCCGKTFDENNPPKLRVVPVEEAVSNREWGAIDHDITRKLVYLAGDENIAKEVFGIVNMNEGWAGLKYPVYEHRKSSEDGYDVDLVLNLNGLRTALVFLMGRPGMALSRKEKKQLVEFLLKKYEMLKKAGIIDNIPESLQNLAKSLKVLEQVRFNVDDDIVSALIELGIEKGLVGLETTEEQVEVDVNKDIVLENFAVALANALQGKSVLEAVSEQIGRGQNQIQFSTYEEGLEAIWNLIADTNIASQLGLNSKEDFDAYLSNIIQSLLNGDIITGLKGISVIENALRGTGAVVAVIPLVLMKLESQNVGNNENGEGDNGDMNTEEPVNNEQPQVNDNDEDDMNGEQPVNEQTQSFITQVKEQVQREKEVGMNETFIALKKLIESRVEGVIVESEDDLVPVVEQIIKDYEYTYELEQELRLELAKKNALLEAIQKGADLETVKEKIESATSPEEVQEIIENLMGTKEEEGRTERVQEKAGKGFAVVDGILGKDTERDEFDDILSDI